MPPSSIPDRGHPAHQSAKIPHTITETTTGTAAETSPERDLNVGNVGLNREQPKRRLRLTSYQQDLVEELEHQLDDTHSRGAFCVIVSDRGLGVDRALSLLRETIELEDAGMIKTSLSRCFIDLCQRDAARQGIDLGFQGP